MLSTLTSFLQGSIDVYLVHVEQVLDAVPPVYGVLVHLEHLDGHAALVQHVQSSQEVLLQDGLFGVGNLSVRRALVGVLLLQEALVDGVGRGEREHLLGGVLPGQGDAGVVGDGGTVDGVVASCSIHPNRGVVEGDGGTGQAGAVHGNGAVLRSGAMDGGADELGGDVAGQVRQSADGSGVARVDGA